MATLKVQIPCKDELGVIRYLLDEIEEERQYNEAYEKEKKKAQQIAGESTGYKYYDYMDLNTFDHEPRESVIKDNAKTIRRLLLKIRKR